MIMLSEKPIVPILKMLGSVVQMLGSVVQVRFKVYCPGCHPEGYNCTPISTKKVFVGSLKQFSRAQVCVS